MFVFILNNYTLLNHYTYIIHIYVCNCTYLGIRTSKCTKDSTPFGSIRLRWVEGLDRAWSGPKIRRVASGLCPAKVSVMQQPYSLTAGILFQRETCLQKRKMSLAKSFFADFFVARCSLSTKNLPKNGPVDGMASGRCKDLHLWSL